jgi:hypothetical protein
MPAAAAEEEEESANQEQGQLAATGLSTDDDCADELAKSMAAATISTINDNTANINNNANNNNNNTIKNFPEKKDTSSLINTDEDRRTLAFVQMHPHLDMNDYGKVHCSVTNHDMVFDLVEIQRHLGGRKYTSIMRKQSDFTDFGDAVIQHPVESSKLYCPVRSPAPSALRPPPSALRPPPSALRPPPPTPPRRI